MSTPAPTWSRGGAPRAATAALILLATVHCGDRESQQRDVPFDGAAWEEPASPFAPPPMGAGLVTDSLSDTLSVVDLGSGEVLRTVRLGRNPVDIDGPHHVVVDPAGGVAYVALSYPIPGGIGPHAGHGSSQALGWVQRLSLADLSVEAEIRVAKNPGDLVVTPDGSRLIVSHFDLARSTAVDADRESARAAIAVIDAAAWRGGATPQPRLIPVCVAPHGMALSPDGAFLLVACYGEDAIAVVDLATESVELVPVGAGGGFGIVAYGPYALTISPDGARLAVSGLTSKDVRLFDLEGGTLVPAGDPVLLPGAAYFASWSTDGTTLWVPYQAPDGVARIEFGSPSQVELFPLGMGAGCLLPHEVEVLGPDRLAVVCEGDHTERGALALLEVPGLEVVFSTPVGVFPDSIVRVGGSPP